MNKNFFESLNNRLNHKIHKSGEALKAHIDSAHSGIIAENCPACQELLAKKNKEYVVSPLKINLPSLTYNCYQGKNPSGACKNHRHFKCKGRHARNHGMLGVLCTCECHLTLGEECDKVEK